MSQYFSILIALIYCFSVQAQGDYLISKQLSKHHSVKSIDSLWKAHKIPKMMLHISNDVDIYEITYKALWIDSTWRIASGLCFVPKGTTSAPATVMYGHGTQIEKRRDVSDNDAQQGICLGFATDGYLALYPDYYGIGKGEGYHLYQHSWTEAMSFIYMLYAVEELKSQLNIKTNGQLFLTGYSQGGHACMAAHKYIEALKDPRFVVTASSPMSGAYDMTGEQEKYMYQVYPKPFYLPYLLISYQEAYNIIPGDIYQIFNPPYDTLLKDYFGEIRDKNFDELNKVLPSIPKDVVKPYWVKEYQNDSTFLFKVKLAENNLYDWKPEAPIQLCYCKGDREVNYANSEKAYKTMIQYGSPIKDNNLSDHLDHNSCAPFAVLATKYFFDRYKKKGENTNMKELPKFKKFLVNFIKRKEEKKYLATYSDKVRY